ncbi:MAG: hypothetical protein ABJN36_12400 [Cyclobacteriaceae bacterium]
MALPSSGTLSLLEIYNEAVSAGYSGGNDLQSLINWSGWFNLPSGADSIADFYGVSAGVISKYIIFDGTNDIVYSNSVNHASLSTDVFSLSFWVRQNKVSGNSIFICWSASTSTTNDMGRIWYYAPTFRFVYDQRNSSGTIESRKQWYLHSDNSSVTGISGNWNSNHRGNTDSDGWTMITLTIDRTDTSTSAYKLYWNSSEVISYTNYTNNVSQYADPLNVTIGDASYSQSNWPTGSIIRADLDQIKWYNKVLSSSEVSTLWNAGKVDTATAGVTSGLATELSFENSLADSGSIFGFTSQGSPAYGTHS